MSKAERIRALLAAGYTHERIAEAVGCSRGYVATVKYRAARAAAPPPAKPGHVVTPVPYPGQRRRSPEEVARLYKWGHEPPWAEIESICQEIGEDDARVERILYWLSKQDPSWLFKQDRA